MVTRLLTHSTALNYSTPMSDSTGSTSTTIARVHLSIPGHKYGLNHSVMNFTRDMALTALTPLKSLLMAICLPLQSIGKTSEAPKMALSILAPLGCWLTSKVLRLHSQIC